jgi:transcription elongation factor GreA
MNASPTAATASHPHRPGDSRVGSRPSPRALITRESERALRATLDRLRHQLEVEFAARIREDRGFGEMAGNDEYLQTLEEASVLASRIAGLERLLDSAAIAPYSRASTGVATVGTIVELEDVSSGSVQRHRLIGDYEELRPDGVSASSPVGQALMGRSAGEEIQVELPGGRKRTLRILAVAPASGSARGAAQS